MKNIFLLLILIFSNVSEAQNTNISGSYTQGSIAGITIYEDHTFAIYGYGTFVLGTYKIENDEINFTPDIQEFPFTVLARECREMTESDAATFAFDVRFAEDETYLMKDDDEMFKIFAENNHSKGKFEQIDFAKKPNNISLLFSNDENLYKNNAYTFNLNGKYNDFKLFYHETIREQAPFTAKVIQENNKNILVCRWGTFHKYEKEDEDEEMLKYIEIYKKMSNSNSNDSIFYFNELGKNINQSNQENNFDINQYIYDQKSNKYIHKSKYIKGENYLNTYTDDDHNEDIILQYKKINVESEWQKDLSATRGDMNILFPNDRLPTQNKDRKKEKNQQNANPPEVIRDQYFEPVPMEKKSEKNKI